MGLSIEGISGKICQFYINYIIFKNVENFKNYFFLIKKNSEGSKNIPFFKI